LDEIIRMNLDDLWLEDRQLQNKAFIFILNMTDKPVDWAYEAWDELKVNLSHKDNHNRAIAAQVLCNLAKSDPMMRMIKDFPALLAVTKDARFVTARHCMQSLWKVGVAGKKQHKIFMDGLTYRFNECFLEKNCTLIRYDIIQSLRNVYDEVKDEKIRTAALELIEIDTDPKYHRKDAGLWRK
jgi:hypothetical protein